MKGFLSCKNGNTVDSGFSEESCFSEASTAVMYYILEMPKWSIWRVLRKTIACGQTVVPDRSIDN